MKKKNIITLLCYVFLISSCVGNKPVTADGYDSMLYAPRWANGFEIRSNGENRSTIVDIFAAGAPRGKILQRVFVGRDGESAPTGFDGMLLRAPVERVVAMSSSHVAMLDAVGGGDKIVGLSGAELICNGAIRDRRLPDVGYDSGLNIERLVSLRPDVVLVYGATEAEFVFIDKLKELGIPYMYVGDWTECSALGKCEWMVALAELFDSRESAEREFEQIESRYVALRSKVRNVASRPTVMLNTPYRDIWYMPSSKSYIVGLIEDGGGEYVYDGNRDGAESKPIDMEEAYVLAHKADYWFNPGTAQSRSEICKMYPRFKTLPVVVSGLVYNNNKIQSSGGGSDFWESGVVRPDVVLRDIISILHPELLDEELSYYQKMK